VDESQGHRLEVRVIGVNDVGCGAETCTLFAAVARTCMTVSETCVDNLFIGLRPYSAG